MSTIILKATRRRGIHRDGFHFHTVPEEKVDLSQEAARSLLGDRFIGTHDTARVWGIDPASIPTIPEKIMHMFAGANRDSFTRTLLFYDTGASLSELRMLLGEEAFDETFDRLSAQLCHEDERRSAGWCLIGFPRSSGGTNEFARVVYGLQMLYLLRGMSLTGVYWKRTDSGISVSQQNGVLKGAVIYD